MFKPDLYLKTVLTLIAFALFWVGYALNTKSVQAVGPTPVILTGIEFPNGTHTLPVGIAAVGWRNDSWQHDPLPVAVSNRLTVVLAKDRPADTPNK